MKKGQQAKNIKEISRVQLSSNNLLYFVPIWPIQRKSAACERVISILKLFIKNDWQIYMFSPQKKLKENKLFIAGIEQITIDPNNYKEMEKSFRRFDFYPDIALFDTFISEEKYSHFIQREFPDTLKILDTQDLHSLRHKRTEKFYQLRTERNDLENYLNQEDMKEVLKTFPDPMEDKLHARELASCYRSDQVFVTSDYEKMQLKTRYDFKNVTILPFFYYKKDIDEAQSTVKVIDLNRRKNFVWIGNFGHQANVNSQKMMINILWPKINKRLPDAKLHIFGSDFSKEVSDMIEDSKNVVKKGLMENLTRLGKYRALLAPLSVGAGIKGKITDSWFNLLPVVTTPIGSEGLYDNTYDDCEELKGIDLTSKYFKPEENRKDSIQNSDTNNNSGVNTKTDSVQSSYDEDIVDYYNYESNLLDTNLAFGGSYDSQNDEQFVSSAVKMYTDDEFWRASLTEGLKILRKRHEIQTNERVLLREISNHQMQQANNQLRTHLHSLIWSETLRSTEALSRYIDLKNRPKED